MRPPGPTRACGSTPELAGTYLNLRAAELAAQRLTGPEVRQRFVSHVRTALADAIERGDPLQPVRLRERESLRREKDRAPLCRE